jgi:hypothetical protein
MGLRFEKNVRHWTMKKFFSKLVDAINLIVWSSIGLYVFYLFIIADKRKSDGVFESATEKIDSGNSHLLTEQEKQRLDDIVYFCEIHKRALRHCKDSKCFK